MEEKISDLEARIDRLVRTQIGFQQEIAALRDELKGLRQTAGESPKPAQPRPEPVRPNYQPKPLENPPPRPRPPVRPVEPAPSFGESYKRPDPQPASKPDPVTAFFSKYTESARADLEKFIGENLISKIGILVLIIGIGIGVKYSIDNNLISPLTRVIVAYLFAFGLIGLAIRLKPKYLNFSAALISGGLATMYFVTYFAYTAYGLIGQLPTFGLMAMCTIFTVIAALFYNRQVIAHIGLVGAYAVPFLLSTDSGNYLALFIYMSMINAGILAISVKKYWRPIFYTASIFTWLIFLGWFATRFSPTDHLALGLTFLAVFFAIFLATRLVHAIVHDEHDSQEALAAVLTTNFIFYAFCFGISTQIATLSSAWAVFSYLAAITAGVLLLSFRFIGKPLVYFTASFLLIIFGTWCAGNYSPEAFEFVLIFLAIFFALFMGVRVAHVVTGDDRNSSDGTIYAAATTVAFYAFCFAIANGGMSLPQTWTIFTYAAVITAVLLAVSFRFLNKYIVFLAFGLTWATFGSWFVNRYTVEEHFTLASIFAAVFFGVFYVSALIHRLLKEDLSMIENSGLVLTNSFLFYGVGYRVLNSDESTAGFLGLFTAAHSALHLAVAVMVSRIRASAVDVVQVLTVLVLTFASIAIPVQLDGNQVTMAWSVEAAVLFWFGRARDVRLFELYSYPVMLLATGSMFFDWGAAYFNRTDFTSEFNLLPFANGNFVTALVYIAAFAAIFAISRDKDPEARIESSFARPFGYLIVGLALLVLYNAFRLEISNYFHLESVAVYEAGLDVGSRAIRSVFNFNLIWQISYTLLFLAAMAFINILKVRSAVLAYVNAILAVGVLGLLATVGMVVLYDLRVSYLAGEGGYEMVSIRYASYAAAAVLMFGLYLYSRDKMLSDKMPAWASLAGFEAVAYSFWLVVASCELVNAMAQFGIPDAEKLGLSILWGIYALMLIVIGIAWNRKHLRVAAICLLAVTLAKLFFYDVSDLDTIPRTILFVSLGLTLLVISFLYNKYKTAIFGLARDGEEES